jgi:hypothetical protein
MVRWLASSNLEIPISECLLKLVAGILPMLKHIGIKFFARPAPEIVRTQPLMCRPNPHHDKRIFLTRHYPMLSSTFRVAHPATRRSKKAKIA